MKTDEEYTITCSMDMHQLVDRLFKPYENIITTEEIEYYRRNLKPSRLQQMMIEIYFFNYTSSSTEFALLRNVDWYKLLLVMRHDIMKRFNITNDTLLDSTLCLILTANIEETPVGDKMYVKDAKYLNTDPDYIQLIEKYYSTVNDINDEAVKKFLITFSNSRYRACLYEEPDMLDVDLNINKRELISELMTFLIIANSSISLENMLEE